MPDVEPELSLFYRHIYLACGVLEYKIMTTLISTATNAAKKSAMG